MSFSTTCFYSSIAQNTTAGLVSLVSDQTVMGRSGRAQFSNNRKLTHAFAGVLNGTRVAFDFPSAWRYAPPLIDPIDADTLGGNLPAQISYGNRGLTLPAQEDIGILATRGGTAAADCVVAIWTTPSFVPAPQGETWSVQATATPSGSSFNWLLQDLTLVNPLPKGSYALVGARATGTNSLFARFVFPGQVERPGIMTNVDPTAYQFQFHRMGAAGLFGNFNNYLLPKVEVLYTGTASAMTFTLDVVPIGS